METVASTTRHPLEPLAPSEISAASAIAKRDLGLSQRVRFVSIELREPSKEQVLVADPDVSLAREAFIVLRDKESKTTREVVVDLTSGRVSHTEVVPDAQAAMMDEEFDVCEEIVKADPRWQSAMLRRGITDFSLAMLDKWAAGFTGADDHPGKIRLARPLTFIRPHADGNAYARPVENVIVTFDLDNMRIVDVQDGEIVPLPPGTGDYWPGQYEAEGNTPRFESQREAMKPIMIHQPEGPSFELDGYGLNWGRWALRIGYTPREGIVLHQVGYRDEGELRPVVYRASLAEMYVPYGDPADTHWNKNVFDAGELSLGGLANSLKNGCDCLGDITYLDVHVNDQDGEPRRIPNAICIHEEDAGIGWKHTDTRNSHPEVRRNRRLVISFFTTVGNYDYGFYWYLYLDGSIEFEVKLTGIVSTGAVNVGTVPEFGTLIAPGLYAPNHQHFFCLRLDMQVDGVKNDLYEVESESVPTGPDNPWGNAWRQRVTHLRSESEAQRLANPATGRSWLVANSEKRNAVGSLIAYKIEAADSGALPLSRPGSQQARRGAFASKRLWASPFSPRERYAAGEYVAQNPGPDGLPVYTSQNRSLDAADLVVWPVICAHHAPRPEDWPVMPVATVGIHLRPVGFFMGNPLLDLAPEDEAGAASCHHH